MPLGSLLLTGAGILTLGGMLGETRDRNLGGTLCTTILIRILGGALGGILGKTLLVGILIAILGGNLDGTPGVLGGSFAGTVYVSHSVAHAQTPLAGSGATPSAVTCAVLCERTEGCLKWSRDREGPEAGRCRLWPQHSAANPLTTIAEPLHQYRMPPEYSISPTNPRLAYRGHKTLAPGGYGLIEKCREDDPDSVPAFPTTDDQLEDLISMGFIQMWCSINDIREEGVYQDLLQEKEIAVKPEWYQHISNNMFVGASRLDADCVLIGHNGVLARPCTIALGYGCEYRL